MTPDQAKQLLTDPQFLAFAAGKKMEWEALNGEWVARAEFDASNFVFSGALIRIAPESARVPLEAKDWDGTVWWVRKSTDDEYLVYKLSPQGLYILSNYLPFKMLFEHGWSRSRDRVTWTPCWKVEA